VVIRVWSEPAPGNRQARASVSLLLMWPIKPISVTPQYPQSTSIAKLPAAMVTEEKIVEKYA
jgi:hypothetical protein